MQGETGFYQSARDILNGGALSDAEEKYIRAEFPSARDRTNALAATVGTAGSFLLALVAIVVAIASGVSEQSAKVITAGNAAATLAAGCTAETPAASCTEQKVEQARQDLASARARLEEVANLNERNAIIGALVLIAFLLGLLAQFTTPVAPLAKTAAEWDAVMDRYQLKRYMIIASLGFQLVAVGVLVYTAFEVFS
jgi:hypothetical protein